MAGHYFCSMGFEKKRARRNIKEGESEGLEHKDEEKPQDSDIPLPKIRERLH